MALNGKCSLHRQGPALCHEGGILCGAQIPHFSVGISVIFQPHRAATEASSDTEPFLQFAIMGVRRVGFRFWLLSCLQTDHFSFSRVLSEFSKARPRPDTPEGQLLPSVLGCSPRPPPVLPTCPAPTHGTHQEPPPSSDISAQTGDPAPPSHEDGDASSTSGIPAPRDGPGRAESTGSEGSQAVPSPTAQHLLSPLLGCPVGATAPPYSHLLGFVPSGEIDTQKGNKTRDSSNI